MKNLIFIVFLMILSGCGAFSRFWANTTGYTEVCVDNVKYLQFPSGVTVKYNQQNGLVELCDYAEVFP